MQQLKKTKHGLLFNCAISPAPVCNVVSFLFTTKAFKFYRNLILIYRAKKSILRGTW